MPLRTGATLVIVLLGTGCASAGARGVCEQCAPSGSTAAIRARLDSMVAGWNRDDIDAHLRAYADSATYMTRSAVLHGLPAIKADLEKGLKRGADLIGTLTFTEVEFKTLSSTAVLTTGRFTLANLPDGRSAGGRFSLIWVWNGAEWKIVHDHSS